MGKRKGFDREYPVKFNSVNFTGKTTVGIKIDQEETDVADLHQTFVGSQLEVELTTDPNAAKDVEGQQKLSKEADLRLEGVAETHRIGFTKDGAATTLVFPRSGVDPALLSRFAKTRGTLRLRRIGEAQNGEDHHDEDSDE